MAADLSRLDAALARTEAAVAEDTELDHSAITLLDQLAQMIRDNAADQDALNALADRLDAANTAGTGSNESLAEALVRNTPAEVPPTEEPPVEEPPVEEPPVEEPPVEEPPVEEPPVEEPPVEEPPIV